jgi:hypothetical protein
MIMSRGDQSEERAVSTTAGSFTAEGGTQVPLPLPPPRKRRPCDHVTDGLVIWSASIDDFNPAVQGTDVSRHSSSPPVLFPEIVRENLIESERSYVKKFHFEEDQQRSLLSVLLQRSLIRSEWKLGDSEYEIRRTKEVHKVMMLST